MTAILGNRKINTPSLRNYKTICGHYKKNISTSKKGSCSKRSNPSKKQNKSKHESSSYYTQNMVNLSKLIRKDKHNSPSIGKVKVKGRRIPKSIANNFNENESIIATNNSYIHNLNISPEGFFYSKDYINSHTEEKKFMKLNKDISTRLNKQLSNEDEEEKELKTLNVHKEALSSVIMIDPYFGDLLKRIKNSYDLFIEGIISNHKSEIEIVKNDLTKIRSEKIAKVKVEIEKSKQKKLNVKKIPKLDLSFLRAEEDEAEYPLYIEKEMQDQVQNKVPMPLLKLKNIKPTQGYQEEFMAKEKEFSPSWREKLAKEKKY